MAISGWGIFLILFFVVVVLAALGWVFYTRYRASKLGLPPPSLNPFQRNRPRADDPTIYRAPAPAPGGIQGWVADKWNSLRHGSGRTAGGAYESTSYGGARGPGNERRGLGPLDPDEAWDARVDHEVGGYSEEQELGLQEPVSGTYGGGGYGGNTAVGVGGIEEGRGRSRSRQREIDARYDEEMHAAPAGSAARGDRLNPFSDHADPSNISLRSMSPRPDAPGAAHKRQESNLTVASEDHSPTERRSMFREDMS